MPSFLFSFRAPRDYAPTADTRADWNGFFQGLSPHLEDIGNPIFSRQSVGETGGATVLGGYTLINAGSLEEARELAAGCPLVTRGGGVEIGEITPLSEMPGATRAGSQTTTA
ncbi:MAG: hypothetical protein JO168_23575 [Solirubrobacterales bacterium]|nr:hypothetical protein [Solirubrobacterales bacterium]MBV9715480.1 hypothetical protein [Solirubrobacterales bacterium]